MNFLTDMMFTEEDNADSHFILQFANFGYFALLLIVISLYLARPTSKSKIKDTVFSKARKKRLQDTWEWIQYANELSREYSDPRYAIMAYQHILNLDMTVNQSKDVYRKLGGLYEDVYYNSRIKFLNDEYRLKAIKYYKMSGTSNNRKIRLRVLMLEHKNLSSAQWLQKARETSNVIKLRDYCEIAIRLSLNAPVTMYKAGLIITNCNGYRNRLAIAKKYFKEAANSNHRKAAKKYIELEHGNMSQSRYTQLGVAYLTGTKSIAGNINLAIVCFEQASSDPEALFALGTFYRDGIGVLENLERAKDYFKQAKEMGSEAAKIEYMMLSHNELTTSPEWNSLGINYYNGKDYILAEACFQRAIKLSPTFAVAYYNIGLLSQKGRPRNFKRAMQYYGPALILGYKKAEDRIREIRSEREWAPYKRGAAGLFGVAAMVGGGFALVFSNGTAAMAGNSVLQGGVSSFRFALFNEDENLTAEDYASQVISSMMGGAASHTVGRVLNPLVRTPTRFLPFLSEGGEQAVRVVAIGGLASLSGYYATTVARNLIERRSFLAAIRNRDALLAFISGTVSSGINVASHPVIESFYNGVFDSAIDEASQEAAMIVAGSLVGSTTGGISAALTTLVSNGYYKLTGYKRPWLEGFKEAILLGMVTGAVTGAFNGVIECHNLRQKKLLEAIEEYNKNIEKLKEIENSSEAEAAKSANAYFLDMRRRAQAEILKHIEWAIANECVYARGLNIGLRVKSTDINDIFDAILAGKKVTFVKYGKGKKIEAERKLFPDAYKIKWDENGEKGKSKKTMYNLDDYRRAQQKANAANRDLAAKYDEAGFNGDELVGNLIQEREKLLMQERQLGKRNRYFHNHKGVKSTLRLDVPMKDDYTPDFSDTSIAWNAIYNASECAIACYKNKTGGFVYGMKLIGKIEQPKYGFDVSTFADQKNNTIYISFKGSQKASQWFIDDAVLAAKGIPASVNRHIKAEIQKIAQQYPNSKIILTGHSLGAAIATYYSSKLGYTALCFDNPGCRHTGDYSNVTSFQSMPNIVNRLNPSKGNIVQLSTPTSTYYYARKTTYVIDFFKPGAGLIGREALGLFSHSMRFVQRSLRRTHDLLTGESSNSHLLKGIKSNSNLEYENDFSEVLQNQIGQSQQRSNNGPARMQR